MYCKCTGAAKQQLTVDHRCLKHSKMRENKRERRGGGCESGKEREGAGRSVIRSRSVLHLVVEGRQ